MAFIEFSELQFFSIFKMGGGGKGRQNVGNGWVGLDLLGSMGPVQYLRGF